MTLSSVASGDVIRVQDPWQKFRDFVQRFKAKIPNSMIRQKVTRWWKSQTFLHNLELIQLSPQMKNHSRRQTKSSNVQLLLNLLGIKRLLFHEINKLKFSLAIYLSKITITCFSVKTRTIVCLMMVEYPVNKFQPVSKKKLLLIN